MKRVVIVGVVAFCAAFGIYYLVNWYDSIMSWGRMKNTVMVRPHEEPLLVMESGTVPVQGGEALIRTQLNNKTFNQIPPFTEELLKLGKQEYQVYCSHCHGENLDGQGTVGQSFSPLPTDLISDQVIQKKNGDLFLHISQGGKRSPALAASMTEESRWAVISYLRFRQRNAKEL